MHDFEKLDQKMIRILQVINYAHEGKYDEGEEGEGVLSPGERFRMDEQIIGEDGESIHDKCND